MPSKRQLAYAAEVSEMYASYATQMADYGARVIELLKETQRAVAARIKDISISDWERLSLKEVSGQIDEALVVFQNEYNQLMAESLLTSGENGVNIIVQPLRNNLNVSLMAFEPNVFYPVVLDPAYQAQLSLSATLIGKASADVAYNIRSKIMIGMAEGLPKEEVINQIIGELAGEKMGFATLNDRAWAIYRTENGRMSSIATEMQMQGAKQLIPNAKKIWFHGAMGGAGQRPRMGHVMLDGVTAPVGEPFVNEVTGELLMYPHDPADAASEVINCGCAHTLDMPSDSYLRDNTLVAV